MNFNIVHLTDIHGSEYNIQRIGDELHKADFVFISGDITHFGGYENALQIIKKIKKYNANIFAVHGNCDNIEVKQFLIEENIDIDRKIVETEEFYICGLGGSLPCPGKTPCEFEEYEAKEWLSELKSTIDPGKPLIFITHQPPFNTINDRIANDYHVGSTSVREFIESVSPILCLTGHIHEGNGIDRIGKCIIVNPGPFSKGQYASLKITGERKIYTNLKQITVH